MGGQGDTCKTFNNIHFFKKETVLVLLVRETRPPGHSGRGSAHHGRQSRAPEVRQARPLDEDMSLHVTDVAAARSLPCVCCSEVAFCLAACPLSTLTQEHPAIPSTCCAPGLPWSLCGVHRVPQRLTGIIPIVQMVGLLLQAAAQICTGACVRGCLASHSHTALSILTAWAPEDPGEFPEPLTQFSDSSPCFEIHRDWLPGRSLDQGLNGLLSA